MMRGAGHDTKNTLRWYARARRFRKTDGFMREMRSAQIC